MSDATLPGRAARVFQEATRRGTTRTTFGPLTAVRDFIDARDAAAAIVAAAFVVEPAERLINCGSGEATPARALVEALARIAGYEGEILEAAGDSARSGGVAWQTADTRRSERVLGWRTTRSLGDALVCLWEGNELPDPHQSRERGPAT
jgi:nucleoside-diphosphate-sugar epimerase